jgi:rfaE bifunctional protein nucleotidyltransferase chain/domain
VRVAALEASYAVEALGVRAVAVTLGSRGALLSFGEGPPQVFSVVPESGDPCGAGDCFAGIVTASLADGLLLSQSVRAAVNAAAKHVARGGAAAFGRDAPTVEPDDDAESYAERVRRAGGTLVATGGCFDLVHAGHVAMLEAARGLGDGLVVCLNSDASVRRLKGPDRPLMSAEDRARVLGSLGCVDAVAIFDDDTPSGIIERLRPDIWVKGGDYAGQRLPEEDVLDQWGGQAVVVPYLEGRSTSGLVQAMSRPS